MDDFRKYASDKKNINDDIGGNQNLFNLVNSIAGKYDGKSQAELMKAIYDQALQGKRQGTLTNSDIDNFVGMLSPMLDEKKRKILFKIADELKKI